MTDLNTLKIFIVEINPRVCEIFRKQFENQENIEIVNSDIVTFYQSHKTEIDCLVSPANAFGIMAGGFDAGLSDIFGWDFQQKVQQYIKDNFFGEQCVGTSFIIKTDIPNLSLIHTPTMREPSTIRDNFIIYYCMRSTLICALKNNVRSIVIPVFGGSCGGIAPEIASKRMKEAYLQIANAINENRDKCKR